MDKLDLGKTPPRCYHFSPFGEARISLSFLPWGLGSKTKFDLIGYLFGKEFEVLITYWGSRKAVA